MTHFTKADWSVGQAVVVTLEGDRGGDADAVVQTIGRAWVTLTDGRRFDFTGRGEADIGWRRQLWPSREFYTAHQARRSAWAVLRRAVDHSAPPPHLTTDEINAMTRMIYTPAEGD